MIAVPVRQILGGSAKTDQVLYLRSPFDFCRYFLTIFRLKPALDRFVLPRRFILSDSLIASRYDP